MVYRVYVERKPGFDGEAKALLGELRSLLQTPSACTDSAVND